ncbi:hypothetical protein SAMD00019534_078990 [Acytostelium subglobosum LB1]|uniref:hypothetical protein n=1 Tax=Acytostelium subglobosum LB1 TaxID=1410327 RepID=UPI0006452351|nr:hypothetical protein SAMD00019534_078990 [Acytostelium subglobosum LB1]GAM24724.1 hypothetical protein SAMD00019534_078990 [Acytostelium subglobosum LB1]|eukprot:XP_012752393.1 hypothetical protein SAMD00019534_078990 [Acytostelium subglobosum LB1]
MSSLYNYDIGEIDIGKLTAAIGLDLRFQGFNECFPKILKRNLWNTIQFTRRHQLLSHPAYQERLIPPLARTAIFDMFTRSIAAQRVEMIIDFKQLISTAGTKFEIPLLQDKSASWPSDLMDVVLNSYRPSDLEPRPMNIDPMSDPYELFYDFGYLQDLLHLRCYLRIEHLRMLLEIRRLELAKHGMTEDQHTALSKLGEWTSNTAIAYLDMVVYSTILNLGDKVSPVPHLLVLDTLVKLQNDLGWMVTTFVRPGISLIPAGHALELPVIINDLCAMVEKHSIDIVKSYNEHEVHIPPGCAPSAVATIPAVVPSLAPPRAHLNMIR